MKSKTLNDSTNTLKTCTGTLQNSNRVNLRVVSVGQSNLSLFHETWDFLARFTMEAIIRFVLKGNAELSNSSSEFANWLEKNSTILRHFARWDRAICGSLFRDFRNKLIRLTATHFDTVSNRHQEKMTTSVDTTVQFVLFSFLSFCVSFSKFP